MLYVPNKSSKSLETVQIYGINSRISCQWFDHTTPLDRPNLNLILDLNNPTSKLVILTIIDDCFMQYFLREMIGSFNIVVN